MSAAEFWGSHVDSVAIKYPVEHQKYVRLLAVSLIGILSPNQARDCNIIVHIWALACDVNLQRRRFGRVECCVESM